MSDRLTAAGEALRDARKRAGMTLRDASRFVDVHFSYLSKVENGHERPGDYLVMRLCNLYGMDPEPMLLERAVAAVPEPVRAAIAARAVDEALSVERVREVLHRGGWGVPSGCIQYTFTTALDGVTSIREDTTADTCEHASLHSTFAADLVAHLTKKEETHD